MEPSHVPTPTTGGIIPFLKRHRRALSLVLALTIPYAAAYRWLEARRQPDADRVRYDIAASDPWYAPESKWSVARDPLPEGCAGLYYVPGVGILPVDRDARWTDGNDLGPDSANALTAVYDDRLNTWPERSVIIELPLLPPFVRVSSSKTDTATMVDGRVGTDNSIALRADGGRWEHVLEDGVGKSRPPSIPADVDALQLVFHRPSSLSPFDLKVPLPVRSPGRGNAVRAERVDVPSEAGGATVVVAAVAAWPGGTAIRLEGWTDDPDDVVLLGLNVRPSYGFGDHNQVLVHDPAGPVVLRDGAGRLYPLRNAVQLAEQRRGPFVWGSWLETSNILGEKPGVDLPVTLLFGPLPDDATDLTLRVGPIRVAHDLLLPEDADRPAAGEARTSLTIPVPPTAQRRTDRTFGNLRVVFDLPLDVSLVAEGAPIVARRANVGDDGLLEIELANEESGDVPRLGAVMGVVAGDLRSSRSRFQYPSQWHGPDGVAGPVKVFVPAGLAWFSALATADAAPSERSGDHQPLSDARPITVSLVRPIVELPGTRTFVLPMEALRANAAANASVVEARLPSEP